MAESRRLGDAETELARQADDVEHDLRDLLLRIPNVPSPRRPDGKSEADNVVVTRRGYDAGRLRRAPAGAALGGRHRARHPRHRAGGQDLGLDVHDAARPRAPRCAGPCASSPSTATPTPSRRSGPRRSSRQPRSPPPASCPSSPTTPTPSSATTSGASPPPRCRSRRSGATRSSTRPTCRCGSWRTRRASGARRARPGATPAGCCGSTSSTRSRSSPTPRPSRRRRCSTRCSPGPSRHHRRARPGVPAARHLHRRPRPEPPPQLRHRGVRPRRRPVARGLVGVVVQRLPGPPGQHPLPARRRQGHRARAHAQRLGPGRPRVLAAILETYRQPDGSVAVPEALWPYTRGARAIGR